jgi:hypothetical protein
VSPVSRRKGSLGRFGALAAVALVMVAWFGFRRSPVAPIPPVSAGATPPEVPAVQLGAPPTPSRPDLSQPAAGATKPAVPASTDDAERALMAELRELGQSSPERSLRLARRGIAEFGESHDAPERAWFAIRALVNLGRFPEALEEARTMVDRYKDTTFANDVERHLLVHPLGLPPRGEQPDGDIPGVARPVRSE